MSKLRIVEYEPYPRPAHFSARGWHDESMELLVKAYLNGQYWGHTTTSLTAEELNQKDIVKNTMANLRSRLLDLVCEHINGDSRL